MKKLGLFLLLLIWACNSSPTEQTLSNPTRSKAQEPETPWEILTPMGERETKRTEWQNPQLILDQLGDLSQKTVVDIGAGSGYFTFKLAKAAEKVIALDIDPLALEYIEEQKEVLGNWTSSIETRLTEPNQPELKEQEVDAVLVVNTFAYIPEQEKYFKRLTKGLKVNGTLLIVDFKRGDIPVGPAENFKIDPSEVRRILRMAGYKNINVDRHSLAFQFIVSAKK